MMVLPSLNSKNATHRGKWEKETKLGKEKGDWNHRHAYKQALKLHSYSHLIEF